MKSNIYKLGQYEYLQEEKRFCFRVSFDLDIYYPRINNKSIYDKYDVENPLIKIIDLSETGVRIVSKIHLEVGDFVSFLMKISNYPSFWCLVEVKWIKFYNKQYVSGCKFYSLSMEQINIIRKYVEKNKSNLEI